MPHELALAWPVIPMTPRSLLLAVVGGMFLGLAFHAFLVNHAVRLDRLNTWLGWWCLLALGFIAGRFLHRATGSGHLAVVGNRIALASVIALCAASIMVLRALVGRRPPARSTWQKGVAALLAVMAVVVFTPWFVSTAGALHDDWLGARYIGTNKGPLYLLLPLTVIATFGACVRTLRSSRLEIEASRGQLYGLFGVVAGTGLAELLGSVGIGPHPQLVEVVLAGLAVTLSILLIKRANQLHQHLIEAVSGRTAELEVANAEAQESEARFRQLSQATIEGLLVYRDGVVVDANDAAGRLFGAEGDALLGRRIDELVTDRADLEPLLSGSQRVVEVTAHGTRDFPAELVSGALEDAEGNGLCVVAVRDISERLNMQRRLVRTDRLASLGALAAGTAHEINNPLTYMLISLEVLQDDLNELSLSDDMRSNFDALVRDTITGAQRVAAIVADLKKLSRDDTTNQSQPLKVADAVNAAVALTKSEVRHRARVVCDFAEVPEVEGQEHRLVQIFVNLLINAAQAMPAGHADQNSITVSVRHHERRWVEIEVADTGEGIPEHLQAEVFEPFRTTKPEGVGTGLGLAICQSIVTAMGGQIDLESRVGEGTRITIRLPAMVASQRMEPESRAPSSAPVRRARVLIVDDEPLIGTVVSRILREHLTTVATNGRDALELIQSAEFDVILCDIMMPEITGLEIYEALKRRRPEAADRMLFMTGGVFSMEERHFVETLGGRCLKKPLAAAELRDKIGAFVGGQRPNGVTESRSA